MECLNCLFFFLTISHVNWHNVIELLQIGQEMSHCREVGNSCWVFKHDYTEPYQHINGTQVLFSTM